MLKIVPPDNFLENSTRQCAIISDSPGTVELSYSGTVTGPASVVIPGSASYLLDAGAGQYVAALQGENQGQDRTAPQTFLIDLDWDQILGATNYRIMNWAGFETRPVFQSARIDDLGAPAQARINWAICIYGIAGYARYTHRRGVTLMASVNSGANPSIFLPSAIEYSSRVDGRGNRWVLELRTDGKLYAHKILDDGTYNVSSVDCALSGTMGGTEALILERGFRTFAKYQRSLTTEEIQAFLYDRTLPQDTPQLLYQPQEVAGTVYDHGSLGLDLGSLDLRDYPRLGYGPPSISHRVVVSAPVESLQYATLTASGPGACAITARRRRYGIPDRASDDQKYETATAEFSVIATPAQVFSVGPSGQHLFDYTQPIYLHVAGTPGEYSVSSTPSGIFSHSPTVTIPPGASGAAFPVLPLRVGSADVGVGGQTCTVSTYQRTVESFVGRDATERVRGYFDYLNSTLDLVPPFVLAEPADVRTIDAAPRSYSCVLQGVQFPEVGVTLRRQTVQAIIAYDTVDQAQTDAHMLMDNVHKYQWLGGVSGFNVDLAFEPGYQYPRGVLTVTLDY